MMCYFHIANIVLNMAGLSQTKSTQTNTPFFTTNYKEINFFEAEPLSEYDITWHCNLFPSRKPPFMNKT